MGNSRGRLSLGMAKADAATVLKMGVEAMHGFSYYFWQEQQIECIEFGLLVCGRRHLTISPSRCGRGHNSQLVSNRMVGSCSSTC